MLLDAAHSLAVNHDAYDPAYLKGILRSVKTVAIVGVSEKTIRPSFFVMQYLIDKGYDVIPVNPALAGTSILGRTVHGALEDIARPIDMVDIFRNAKAAGAVVDQALQLDPLPKAIWMQLGVRNDEAAARAEAMGVKVVMNRCPKMEYGKLSGEWTWVGGASGLISSKRPALHKSGKVQSLGLGRAD